MCVSIKEAENDPSLEDEARSYFKKLRTEMKKPPKPFGLISEK